MAAEPRPNLRVVRDELTEDEKPENSVTAGTFVRLPPCKVAPQLTDEVVAALKRGDVAAWEAAYLACHEALRGFLMVRLPVCDVEDALTETYLRGIDKVGGFRSADARAFRAWLYRIASNVANDRHRQRHRETSLDDSAERPDLSSVDLAEGLLLAEQHNDLDRALASLDEDDRQVLVLRFRANLTSDEVGKVVGKRPSAVRMQQKRALAELAKRLEQ